ncbi:SCO3374 family protein [Streptomyces sp. DSM 41527]|uniref:SCO3374 family protein n=1 Tax=Streptomyces mooreae TaxID=3075523 RepID=A0ABU2TH30_9ACTN|nr:SCO3374 family protein [Streptomyces sp. DSM 41527]MDT0460248.1 SCO3374 family protein [Streptomyces sp. DSM 41527]
MARVLPRPRAPLAPRASVRHRYEEELGWPTTGTEPVELLTGLRFDVLEMPADAGSAVLRRLPHTGPVALLRARCGGKQPGDRPKLLMLIAAGGAEELPGILEWLEWGTLAADLTTRGTGDRMPAPAFPGGTAPSYGFGSWEAATWVRPPRPGYEAENSLPTTGSGAGIGDVGGAPDLVRLVSAAATECHRARLWRARNAQSDRECGDQPLAFSNASRMSAGTRPRSLTL